MSNQASDNAAHAFGDFGRDNPPEPSVTFHELSEGDLNAMRQGADIVRVGVGPQPFNASTFPGATRRFPPVVSADETNYATLTFRGVAAPVCNVVFCDDVYVSVDDLRFAEPQYFFASFARKAARAPRRYRLRAKRHEKAAAKRDKMRSARYAARWEQAHLRDKLPPRDYRVERQSLARELAESVERIDEKIGVSK